MNIEQFVLILELRTTLNQFKCGSGLFIYFWLVEVLNGQIGGVTKLISNPFYIWIYFLTKTHSFISEGLY